MRYTVEQLKEIVDEHQKWLNSFQEGERANLSGANLSCANLRNADLRNADLRNANLSGANLDYSCLPLHCGLIGVKVDKRIAAQVAFYFLRMVCEDEDVKAVQQSEKIVALAKLFHWFSDCGGLPDQTQKVDKAEKML